MNRVGTMWLGHELLTNGVLGVTVAAQGDTSSLRGSFLELKVTGRRSQNNAVGRQHRRLLA